jgi:hypothetical protein
MKTVNSEACDFPSELSFRATTPLLSHSATEQRFVAVSRQSIIVLQRQAAAYFSL